MIFWGESALRSIRLYGQSGTHKITLKRKEVRTTFLWHFSRRLELDDDVWRWIPSSSSSSSPVSWSASDPRSPRTARTSAPASGRAANRWDNTLFIKHLCVLGREPWYSSYGWWIMFERCRVRISVPYRIRFQIYGETFTGAGHKLCNANFAFSWPPPLPPAWHFIT